MSRFRQILLEICVDSEKDAHLAFENGADRVEICSNLECGGVTPNSDVVRAACSSKKTEVVVLIRPRAGNFVYARRDLTAMQKGIDIAMDCGAVGVAIGALTSSNSLDLDTLAALSEHAHGLDLVMHRAFDHVEDPILAIDELVELGFDRILSSGLHPTALEGATSLRKLVSHADERIQFVAAGNVRSSNAATIISTSAISEIHSSARIEDSRSPDSKTSNELGTNAPMSTAEIKLLAETVTLLTDHSGLS